MLENAHYLWQACSAVISTFGVLWILQPLAEFKMNKVVLIALFQFLTYCPGFTQQNEDFNIEIMPEFKNGDPALFEYVGKETQFPKAAKQYCVSGIVYVGFLIDSLGNVHSAEAISSLGHGCDEEAVRVIMSTSGKWNPGIKDGKAINVFFKMPIRFTMREPCEPFYLEYLKAGDKLFEKDKFQKAILQYDKILKIKSYHPEALLNRGLCKLKIGDSEGACEDWNRIPELLNEKAQEYLLQYCN